ncbi:hypothetical protein [Nocardia sp. NBC_00511]|uniref:hypothetical protein n=1 Tax=Nocardia sp. NBC_00511 TaxID=2903591 RepID=UPI0030E4F578
MSPEQIRAEAVDRLARMQFELDNPTAGERYEDWAPQYRREMAKYVDAHGDMLPTGVDEYRRTDYDAQGYPVVHQFRRYVTDWQEVTE